MHCSSSDSTLLLHPSADPNIFSPCGCQSWGWGFIDCWCSKVISAWPKWFKESSFCWARGFFHLKSELCLLQETCGGSWWHQGIHINNIKSFLSDSRWGDLAQRTAGKKKGRRVDVADFVFSKWTRVRTSHKENQIHGAKSPWEELDPELSWAHAATELLRVWKQEEKFHFCYYFINIIIFIVLY